MNPTVFIVDDHSAIRESLVLLLKTDGLQVTTYATAEEFLRSYNRSQPGCLLLDVRIAGMSGLELQEKLKAQRIRVPVIITGHGDVPTTVHAMRMGVFDFIEKPFTDRALLEAIHRATELDARMRQGEEDDAAMAARIAQLTPRELEVLRLLAKGYAAKQVAARLCRSHKTICNHTTNLMKKLDLHGRVDLTRLAIRAKLVEL